MWEESVGNWGPELLDALSRIEDPKRPRGVQPSHAGGAGLASVRGSLPPAAGAAVEV